MSFYPVLLAAVVSYLDFLELEVVLKQENSVIRAISSLSETRFKMLFFQFMVNSWENIHCEQ